MIAALPRTKIFGSISKSSRDGARHRLLRPKYIAPRSPPGLTGLACRRCVAALIDFIGDSRETRRHS
jgi:hypothetical protein